MASNSRLFALALLITQSTADLRPESELTHSCFGFPTTSFNRQNSVKKTYGSSPHEGGELKVGDTAIDFTLSSLDGKDVTLSKLLTSKPVFIVWGMYTCPAFQGLTNDKFTKCSYTDEWDLVEKYKDDVHVVHLVGPEPHPLTPDTNFDVGELKMNYWSTVRQPKTFADRLVLTTKIQDMIHPSSYLLSDKLSSVDGEDNQGVWCSMGLGARTALLIGTDGKLAFKEGWFNYDDSSSAIEEYLRKN